MSTEQAGFYDGRLPVGTCHVPTGTGLSVCISLRSISLRSLARMQIACHSPPGIKILFLDSGSRGTPDIQATSGVGFKPEVGSIPGIR